MENDSRIRKALVPAGSKTNLSRRKFISSCSACAACLAMAPVAGMTYSCSSNKNRAKLKIHIVYSLHEPVQKKPDWPNVGFDFNPVMQKINGSLKEQFKETDFIYSMAVGPEDAAKIVEQDKLQPIDGYIVYQLNCWNQVVQTISKTGKPVLYVDFQFGGSGGFLVYNSSFIRNKSSNIGFVASSRMGDLLAAVSCFDIIRKGGTPADFAAAVSKSRIGLTPVPSKFDIIPNEIEMLSPSEGIKRLGSSKILAVMDQNSRKADPVMGIPVEYIPFSEVNAAWSSADKNMTREIAEKWQKTALEVTGVSQDTLLTSAAMYVGMKSILKKHGAEAITINCLGGFYGGHIHAYPCLGFYELNNEGLVGGCECDVRSTATMLGFSIMTKGRPGFISDPVIDTSKRQIIYAHCVAPSKVFGPAGPENPIRIMTHSEDRNGASVRSVLPVNYLTTTLEINNDKKEILFHQAVAVENDPDDRACRTKLGAEPLGDLEKLFTMWDTWGWHRVTFYGDLKEPVHAWADASGWQVIEEA